MPWFYPLRVQPWHMVKYTQIFWLFLSFFLRLSSERLQVAIFDQFERSICQNACFHARMCLLGVKMFHNHFWGFRVGKTQKFSPEIGIFHVKRKTLITRKRSQISKKFQLISIGNPGRSFRIRHFYLRKAPPRGRNRDFAISGLLIWSNSPETMLDTTNFTITDV